LRFFFHPDCRIHEVYTVGFGFSPNRPAFAGSQAGRSLLRRDTAGEELHLALKTILY